MIKQILFINNFRTKFQELDLPPQDMHIGILCESNKADNVGLMSMDYYISV